MGAVSVLVVGNYPHQPRREKQSFVLWPEEAELSLPAPFAASPGAKHLRALAMRISPICREERVSWLRQCLSAGVVGRVVSDLVM